MNLSPRLVLFAGPNGSGKSSVTTPETLAAFDVRMDHYINADDIARTLGSEMAEGTQEERERDAFRRARSLRVAYRERGESFAFETVFSHPSTLIDMQKCRSLGFEIVVLFVTTRDAEINVERVSRRFRSGGHDVPVDRVRNRYERTMRLSPRIIEDSDHAFVYDNSTEALTVHAFDRASLLPGDNLPDFLKRRIAEPLETRKHERDEIARQFGTAALPDEESGEYAGTIVWLGAGYAVQKTAAGFVRHDRLLFERALRDGETVTIRYKDNAATVPGD